MKHRLVVPPKDEPVTLSEIKDYLRVKHTQEDALIQSQLAAARGFCENAVRMSFLTQVRESIYRLPFYGGEYNYSLASALYDPDRINKNVRLIMGPVSEIEEVAVYLRSDEPVIVGASAFVWNEEATLVEWIPEEFAAYISNNEFLKITYTAGLPFTEFRTEYPSILEAIKMTVAVFYDQRGYSQQSLPPAVWPLLSPYWSSPTYVRR